MGLRLLEVLCYRERGQRRETRLLDMLKFIHRWEHPAGCRGSCSTPTGVRTCAASASPDECLESA